MNDLVLAGGTLIDGTGAPARPNGSIRIEAGRIKEISRQPPTPSPAQSQSQSQAQFIDANGKFIIPGLMDANVHLYAKCTANDLLRSAEDYASEICKAARVCLLNGLTTVFDTWGPREALAIARERIRPDGEQVSRVFFAGNIIGLGGPTSDDFFPHLKKEMQATDAGRVDNRWEQNVGRELMWCTPLETRERVRDYIRRGQIDFVKYASSCHREYGEFIAFSADCQRAIVEEAHRAGLIAQSHSTTPESLRMAVDAGVDMLQHPDITGFAPMPDATLEAIVQKKVPCAALFVTHKHLEWTSRFGSEPARTFQKVRYRNDERLVASGATIVLTTDSVLFDADTAKNPMMDGALAAEDSPLTMGEAHFLWLRAAVELGMPPMDALQAATANVAKAYRVEDRLGTVEEQKFADLLILNSNPLDNPEHYRDIHIIIKEGIIVDDKRIAERAS